ncbi:MAG: DUF1292 domain-containing protein [Erysipelotrichaceae bacterium]|jgi:uncharacterized protein YrzB (UPF0473 family)|nr:DUF1292 domain-containing protein [Erysipelotrichaceae bacterium]MBQ1304286.1 DUF1292 domain-containing protein [Erysipelotrichaceae bacterium]MBQ1758028.1 DUF1292 domain-containing protein [Erysipelotrichaceae bacterium]MBQ2685775.1 DUF1292 domain-containing protein [Erysipelotrichaceae bacterium]MBR2791573.1 DUF1292 domain-containing protein [Erysipelotrichaceae bacterium]
MDSNKLYVTTDNGEEKEMEILFTFDSEQYGKSYVLFYDPKDPEATVYGMAYDEEGNLYAVESQEEWEMIEEVFEGYEDGQKD